MNLVMRRSKDESDSDDGGNGGGNGGGGTSRKFECENCRLEFPNKTSADRHMLFCRTLTDIRRGGGGGAAVAGIDDPLMPTQREMFVLIQELAAKYNKVKDELDVMKQWAKMVGRRIGGSGGGGGSGSGVMTGLDFTSVTRQKRQNMEVILNEEDAEHPDLAEARPGFAEWLTSPSRTVTDADLNVVFNEDIVAGITSAILRVLAGYTAAHMVPFKLADIKQGAFYIYDTAFKANAGSTAEIGLDPPTTTAVVRKWRAIEPCEFQLMVRTFHKLLFQEFKKWQDANWEAQRELTKQRQKAASSYQQMFKCSPAMASCDGMYPMPGAVEVAVDDDITQEEPITPPSLGGEPVLSEDFATLYNKYADKMMGGALSDEAIVTKVRAKLWKDMKAWRL